MDKPTYRQEIERGQSRLEEVLQNTIGEDWEKVVDWHKPYVPSYSIHSDRINGYVAEVVSSEGSAEYIVMADPGFGRHVSNLLKALLGEVDDWGLDVIEQHETCPRDECPIGAAVDLVRHISRKA